MPFGVVAGSREAGRYKSFLRPSTVQFFSKDGKLLSSRISLEKEIHIDTKVPVEALRGQSLSKFRIDERTRWVVKCKTTVKEDKAYCLLGTFGVVMPLCIWGRGIKRLYTAKRGSIEATGRARQRKSSQLILYVLVPAKQYSSVYTI